MTGPKNHYSALLVGFALALLPMVAQAETLQEAIETAWNYHPSVTAAEAGTDFAAEEHREESSNYFPEISMGATGGRMYADNSTSRGLSVSRGAGYSYLWEGTASIRQMIFDGFKTSNRVESAEARQRSAALNVADVKENLALRTAQTYIDLMRTRKGLAMLKEYEQKVASYLGRIKILVNEGAADESDYQQALDIRVVLQGLIDDYQGQVAAGEAYYMELTGHLPGGEMITPMLPPGVFPATMDEAIVYADDHHPLLLAAAFTARSTEYDTEAERAELFPDLSSEISHTKTDKRDLIGGEAVDTRAVVRLNWDFETGGGQLARIKKSQHLHRQAMARMAEVKTQIERDIRLAYNEYDTAQAQLKNQDQRRDLNNKLIENYKTQFEGARITLLQLMQSDNQYFTTQLEKMNGEHRVLTAQYNILARMGRLQEALTPTLAEESVGPAADEQN